jgi:predicted deacetylase
MTLRPAMLNELNVNRQLNRTTAQFLLRLDDLCPTVRRDNWLRMRSLLNNFGIHPLLAVVPDNQDPELVCSPADTGFWEQMRQMESDGATVALHGYRHLCRSRGKSLIRLHAESEFAGVPVETQRSWIHEGMRILRSHGLNPQIFVAPRHGFDRQTLIALRDEGVSYLSDGFARIASLRGGITWIPQQLWSPVEKSKGLWTICLHSNTMRESHFAELGHFLSQHHDQFTSFKYVQDHYKTAPLPPSERVYEWLAYLRVQVRRKLAAWRA